MKILVVGASGSIGGEVLNQCLAHEKISRVIAFVRRDLSPEVSKHPKLDCVVIRDFSIWPKEVLEAHADAVGMIWNMGSYTGSVTADLEYPLAFLDSMERVLSHVQRKDKFKYVHLSGKFVRQDQDQKLWFLEKPRKMKGLLETRALAFAESHATTWETLIVKPGGVVTRQMKAVRALTPLLSDSWFIRIEELAAFMLYLAMNAEDEDLVTENRRIASKGRSLAQSQTTCPDL